MAESKATLEEIEAELVKLLALVRAKKEAGTEGKPGDPGGQG